MNESLIKRIEYFLFDKDNSLFLGKPAEDKIITDAEKKLNVKFDKDYIQFIKLFGGSFVGLPVYAFSNSEMLSNQTVVDLTNEFRESYEVDDRCPIIQSSYVISVEGNGDPIMINPSGEVLIYYHDDDVVETIAPSFEKLIEDNLN